MALPALRDRQTGGIPLSKELACVLTLVGAYCVFYMSVHFWSPFFGIPEEFRMWIAFLGSFLYIISCTDRVPENKERAQLFFGTYTGISYSAGICFQPKIPFPTFVLVMRSLSKDVSEYLGWVLKGDVSIQSIFAEMTVSGVTADGIPVEIDVGLVFDIVEASKYLAQTDGGANRDMLVDIIKSESASQITQRVIRPHGVNDLRQGNYLPGFATIKEWITDACAFAYDFGLKLSRSPVVHVRIPSKQLEAVVNMASAQALLAKNAVAVGKSFAEFKKENPDLDDALAMNLFSAAEAMQTNPVTVNVVKFTQ